MRRLMMITLALGVAMYVDTAASAARIKCWLNEQGHRECSDTIPPEYSKQGHEILTEDGVVIERVEKAPSAEELEQQRLEQEAEEQRRIVAERRRRMDQVLLQTFAEEDDIVRSQEDKVSIIEGQITMANERIRKLQERLQKFQGRVEAYRTKEADVPQSITQGMDSANNQITDNENFIIQKREEQQRIVDDHQTQLERFRTLTSGDDTTDATP